MMTYRVPFTILLLASITTYVAAEDAVLDAKRIAAAKLLKDGKPADAQKLYEEIVAADNSVYTDHLALARLYDKSGNTPAAISAYQTVVRLLAGTGKLAAGERSALAESEKRLKVLDEVTQKLDDAISVFVKSLKEIEKDAARDRNTAAAARIEKLLAQLAARQVVKVSAKLDWQDSGIDLVAGKTYRVSAAGSWTMNAAVTNSWSSADGFDAPQRHQGLPYGILVGKIESTDVAIALGSQKTFKSPASGRLFLRANDAQFSDNGGSLDVTITND